LVAASACTSSADRVDEPARAAPSGATAATIPTGGTGSAAWSDAPRPCENPDSGTCQGELTEGEIYSTTDFIPGVTYSVPTAGWANWEDNPGNFLLVPPRNDLAGVNAETSDFVGAATSIAAGRFTDLSGCETASIASVPNTPKGIATWMRNQPELDVTRPAPVSVGGLHGLVIDVRTTPGARLPTCTVDGQRFTDFLLYVGLGPTSLAHGVRPAMMTRLYLLDFDGGTLAVQVVDIRDAPGTLRSLSAVAESLTFDV